MGETTGIEWTDATWNPWYGCEKISPGCKLCYMYRDMERYGRDPYTPTRSKTTFRAPLKWADPRLVFTCSWSDFFIAHADPWRTEALEIIRATPHHTYQILTKRPERVPGCLERYDIERLGAMGKRAKSVGIEVGLPRNVWIGVSVENADYLHRIDQLGAVRAPPPLPVCRATARSGRPLGAPALSVPGCGLRHRRAQRLRRRHLRLRRVRPPERRSRRAARGVHRAPARLGDRRR